MVRRACPIAEIPSLALASLVRAKQSGELVLDPKATERGLRVYLRQVSNWPNELPLPYLGVSRRITDLYVWPDVFKEKPTQSSNRPGTGSLTEERLGRFSQYEARSSRVPWQREYHRIRRAVITGLPGEGKTILCQISARQIALASLDELEDQDDALGYVAVPIWLRMADVADCGMAAAIDRHVQRTLEPTRLAAEDPVAYQSLRKHLLDLPTSPHAFVFLDAMDEVSQPISLYDALRVLAEAPCRLLVTSRPYGYNPGYLPFHVQTYYKLAPFKPHQRRKFIKSWFAQAPRQQERVHELVGRNPSFGDLTQNGLLLTFTCKVAERHGLDPNTARRKDLYFHILRDIVSGHGKSVELFQGQRLSMLMRVIRQVAWQLFSGDHNKIAFDDELWIDAIIKATQTLEPLKLDWSIDELFDRLNVVGLVVPPAEGQTMFLHRSFFEFLVAEYIAGENAPLDLIVPFLWKQDERGMDRWTSSAAEVIRYLGGVLVDATPLIQMLLDQERDKPDYFRTMLRLAGAVLTDADSRVDADLRETVAVCNVELLVNWSRQVSIKTSGVRTVWRWSGGVSLEDFVPSLGQAEAVRLLLDRLRADEDQIVRENAAQVLGILGHDPAVPLLAERLLNDASQGVRLAAKHAIGTIGNELAETTMIEWLENDATQERQLAAEILGLIGSKSASVPLIDHLQYDSDEGVRWRAARALGEIRSTSATDYLLDRLKNDDSNAVRRAATSALGMIGSESAVAAIATRIQTGPMDAGSRRSLDIHNELWAMGKAIGAIGTESAVNTLIDFLQNDDSDIRSAAVSGLVEVGDALFAPELVNCLQNDADSDLRGAVAKALGKIGSESAVVPLVNCYRNDRSGYARFSAEEALGEIGSNSAIPALLEKLKKQRHPASRGNTCTHLGMIGSEQAVSVLIQHLLSDDHDYVRSRAASALGRCGNEEAVLALVNRLQNDDSEETRVSCASALGAIGDETAIEPLVSSIKHDSKGVRAQSAKALFALVRRSGIRIEPIEEAG